MQPSTLTTDTHALPTQLQTPSTAYLLPGSEGKSVCFFSVLKRIIIIIIMSYAVTKQNERVHCLPYPKLSSPDPSSPAA